MRSSRVEASNEEIEILTEEQDMRLDAIARRKEDATK